MPPRLLLATPAQDIALVDLTETPALRVVREAGVRDGYAWPTWSPDGAHVLASQGWRADDGDPRLGLVSLDLDDAAADAERPFSNPEGHREPIAPGVMHYAYWGPDGRRAIVVARGEDGLTLTLLTRAPAETSDPGGAWAARKLIDGAPMFSAWSPDGRTLAVHAGAQLVLFDTDSDAPARRVLADQPRFRAPAWSPDGSALYYAAPGSAGPDLLWRSHPDSGARDVVTQVDGLTALLASPASDDLALLTLDQGGLGGHDLRLIDAADPRTRWVERGHVFGAFWSPDGTRLFYITRAGIDLDFTLMRYDVAAGRHQALTRFRVSPGYSTYCAFFDQYALSHALITPDGRWLSIGGNVPGNGGGTRPFALDQGCYVVPADASAPPRRVADGEIGFFAPTAPAPLRPDDRAPGDKA